MIIVDSGELNVTIVKTDQTPITGEGPIGVLYGIVDENVVGYVGQGPVVESMVRIEDVKYIDAEANQQVIYNDTITVNIIEFDSSIVSTTSIKDAGVEVYPNPAKDRLFIKSEVTEIQQVEILDVTGRIVESMSVDQFDGIYRLGTTQIIPGIYFVKLMTNRGILMEKVLIQRE